MPRYQHHCRDDDRNIAANGEFAEAGNEEYTFYSSEHQSEDHCADYSVVKLADVYREEDGHHEHAYCDRQAVCVLHARATSEVQHDRDAEYPQRVIDRRNVDLTLCIRRIVNVQMRHEVEYCGFVHERIAAAYERLAGYDGCESTEYYRYRP